MADHPCQCLCLRSRHAFFEKHQLHIDMNEKLSGRPIPFSVAALLVVEMAGCATGPGGFV